jgi:hypothetical protein
MEFGRHFVVLVVGFLVLVLVFWCLEKGRRGAGARAIIRHPFWLGLDSQLVFWLFGFWLAKKTLAPARSPAPSAYHGPSPRAEVGAPFGSARPQVWPCRLSPLP